MRQTRLAYNKIDCAERESTHLIWLNFYSVALFRRNQTRFAIIIGFDFETGLSRGRPRPNRVLNFLS